jgi:cell division control protein 6
MTNRGIPDLGSETGGGDDIFATGDIFARRELLRVGHVPERDRIVGRDDELKSVGQALGPTINGAPPSNVVIYGKTGTGKSLVARHVTQRARQRATANGISFSHAYIDCSDADTETRVARELASQLAADTAGAPDIPMQGIGSNEYYRYIWDLLEERDVCIILLDEIDILRDEDVLMQLSRAEESGKTDCYIGVISISNKIEFRDNLGERIDSSLQDEDVIFQPYDAGQLRTILENRRDAFKQGVLNDAVIPKVAALAAREHGDARKAINILQKAGELAERENHEKVTEEHVDRGQQKAEVQRFQELVSGSTPHVKYLLRALAQLTESHESDAFATHEIYKLYQTIAAQEQSDPLSQDRVYRLLKEQSFLGITESRHTGGGKSEGSYLEHRLMRGTDIVLEALTD